MQTGQTLRSDQTRQTRQTVNNMTQCEDDIKMIWVNHDYSKLPGKHHFNSFLLIDRRLHARQTHGNTCHATDVIKEASHNK